jgi:hypothetical protein
MIIQIPKRFYDDHVERDLPAPTIVHETGRYYLIRSDDPALPELLNDARYYANANGPDMAPRGLRPAALALIHAVDEALP